MSDINIEFDIPMFYRNQMNRNRSQIVVATGSKCSNEYQIKLG